MTEIFVSWAAPDKPTVDAIMGRLEDVGLPVNEYSAKMRAGEDIRGWISEGIEKATVVLAVVSAEALRHHADWISYEISLAAGRMKRSRDRLETLILVRVGHVPDHLLPGRLQPDGIRFFDLAAGPAEAQIEALVNDLSDTLDTRAPFVIPTALLAMTSAEFDDFAASAAARDRMDRLAALCRTVGMPDPPHLWQELRRRYGDTSSDFTPYGDGHRLIDLTQGVLRGVNRQRNAVAPARPLYLRWYSRAELDQPSLRDRWSQGHSVLIIDAVSALHTTVAEALQNMPKSLDARRAAVICLPPYTLHTRELESLIEESLKDHRLLYDTFRAWRKSELPSLAFDIPTETSLKRWLGQLLFGLETTRLPFPANLSAMSDGDFQPVPAFQGMPGG